jgi:hypothetical protein
MEMSRNSLASTDAKACARTTMPMVWIDT